MVAMTKAARLNARDVACHHLGGTMVCSFAYLDLDRRPHHANGITCQWTRCGFCELDQRLHLFSTGSLVYNQNRLGGIRIVVRIAKCRARLYNSHNTQALQADSLPASLVN